MKRTYPIIIEKDEDGFFVATNPAFQGCYSQGKTIEEALENVREATELCLQEIPAQKKGTPSADDISLHLITA